MPKQLPLQWRRIGERYRLEGNRCLACGQAFFPPRPVCPACRRKGRMEKLRMSGKGEIYSYTVVHSPPEGFDYLGPYVLAAIKLVEGPMITAQVVDAEPEEIKIGTLVKSELRRICEDGADGAIFYGYKFVKDERPAKD